MMFESLRASAVGLFGSKDQKFKVTAKGASRERVVIHWSLIRWQLAFVTATVGGIAYRLFDGPIGTTPAEVEVMNLFWGVYNVVTLLLAAMMCVEQPRFRTEERFAADEPAELRLADAAYPVRLRDLSIAGCSLEIPQAVGIVLGATVRVVLAGAGEIQAEVIRVVGDYCHLRFVQDGAIRGALIRKIFSGSYVQSVTRMSSLDFLKAVSRRAFG
jgi:cellulose synthase (UDP-forming)